jgi:pimeloyl-ACP methyl ester carboxylesterase
MNEQESVSKRDLAGRDSNTGGVTAGEILAELPRETVLLIHGTSANEPASWWLPSSEFCQKLDSALLQRKSPARCWTHVGTRKVFAWTGHNLETERRIGGDRLAKEIRDLESITDIRRYHIVAHSHGGNVVLHALRSLAEDPKKLGAVIFLGTPVLCFSRLPSWLNRSGLAMLLYGSGLVLSIVAAWLGGESLSSVRLSEGSFPYAWSEGLPYPWFSLMTIGFALLFLYEWLTRPRRLSPIYGGGHSHAFEFVPDEAMTALQLSLAIAQRPGEALKQLYSTNTPYEYAVEPPRPEFWKDLWSDFKSTALYRLFKDSGFPNPNSFWQAAKGKDLSQKLAAIFGIIVMAATFIPLLLLLPDSFINIHYFQKERPVLADIVARFRSINKTISNTSGTVAFVIAGLSLSLMFLWRFLLVVIKFARAWLACVVQLFLQGPGVRIMGLVVRNAAFGGQCKHVLGPQQLPENERARNEAISDELNQKMNDLSKNTVAQAGEALYFALAEGDAMQLKKHILARLTDPKLAHCQYYCEDEIINRIAELIAAPGSNHPRELAH